MRTDITKTPMLEGLGTRSFVQYEANTEFKTKNMKNKSFWIFIMKILNSKIVIEKYSYLKKYT